MDGYSRLIAWLRVLLPLMALAILSTLFLLSRNTEPSAAIPFAAADIRDRVERQQITRPFFSGTTSSGARVSLSAAMIETEALAGENAAEDLSAQLDLVGGTRVTLKSERGSINLKDGTAILTGDVRMKTSTGFTMTSDLIEAATSGYDVRSPGPVAGTGPFGTLDAGSMEIKQQSQTENPHLLFTNGIRLVYQPQNVRE